MKAVLLQCNYRENPLGIDDQKPRPSWICQGGKKQCAYQVTAQSEDGALLWTSGKVEGNRMHCEYDGPKLKSAQRVHWSVRLWDENGHIEDSECAWFEMGLLEPSDWMAKWIAGVNTDRKERLSADCFQKRFAIRETVRRARLYVTACGVYSAVLNGAKLPGVLAPGCTEYDKRLYYQVYDLTALLKEENELNITLADGWFKGKLGSTNEEYVFGTQLKLLAQLVMEYTDGSRQTVCTDESWRWSNDGPILYADLMDGEHYDARRTPSYAQRAVVTTYPICPSVSPADGIFEQEVFAPKLLTSPSGAKLLDFGQNLAGYVRFRVQGEAGQQIRLRLGEALDHGEFSDLTLQMDMPGLPVKGQEIVYTCAGGKESFQPDFFYAGFRYALVEGLDKVDPADFEAVAVYSALRFTGSFACSNQKLTQFARNTLWSLKSNFVDIPTDCPQREKSGWTGDAQIFAKTACYFADPAAFYRKWLRDVRDCQEPNGCVVNVCPRIRSADGNRDVLNGAVGWADATVILPYTLWKLYADKRFILENLALMLGWRDYMIQAAADKTFYHLPDDMPIKDQITPYLLGDSPYAKYIIESGLHWGEWCEPDVDGVEELLRPKAEITTAYMHYSMELLDEMLRAVGQQKDAALCREYADGAKKAYNYHFVRDGKINAPRQAPMVRALALDLLDQETAKNVAADLNRSALQRQYTVGTGFLSTPFVLGVLAKYGYLDTAYRMLENTVAPGWLAMVEQGATTVWENYLAYDEDGHPLKQSMNHYSPGAVCAFLFDTVCGVEVSGENRFTIRPQPGGSLSYAEARYDSPYGTVFSRWERTVDATAFRIEIPANTEAELALPDGTQAFLSSGSYSYLI